MPKVFSFGPVLGPIYPWKTQNISKNQNFDRNCILRTITWHKSQPPDKLENSYKNFQKYPFFGLKMGLNCPLGLAQGAITKSHIAYSICIFPYFMNSQVLRSGYFLFSTLRGRYPCFFCLVVQLGPFWGVWGQ